MTTIKSYTDLEQSKGLAKILPIESADMVWLAIEDDIDPMEGYYEAVPKDNSLVTESDDIPCWSLAALLEHITFYDLSKRHGKYTCTSETVYGVESVGWYESPIEACVSMIMKLHEKHLL